MSILKNRFFILPIVVVVVFFFFKNFRLTGLGNVGVEMRSEDSMTANFSEVDKPTTDAPLFSNRLSPAEKFALVNSIDSEPNSQATSTQLAQPEKVADRIRIASFDVRGLTGSSPIDPASLNALAAFIQSADVLAIQSIPVDAINLFEHVVSTLNAHSSNLELLVGPRIASTSGRFVFAFVVNRDRIEVDRTQLYAVDDPQNLLEFEPLVGWFRVRNDMNSAAFTFSLINGRIADRRLESELPLLPEILRSVRFDGRGEDDCLLVGDFQITRNEIPFLNTTGLTILIEPIASMASGVCQNNIAIPVETAFEFARNSGRWDFQESYNLSVEQLSQLGGSKPVWAEFSTTEHSVN